MQLCDEFSKIVTPETQCHNDILMLTYTCRKTVSRDISAAVPKLVAVCITVAVHWLSLTWTFNTATGEASSCTGTFVNEDTNIDLLKMLKCTIFNFPCMTLLCITFRRRAWRKAVPGIAIPNKQNH